MKKKEPVQPKLFEVPAKEPGTTCWYCAHRQRWRCGGSIIQYCGARKSNRTANGLLKIRAKDPSCPAYKVLKHE